MPHLEASALVPLSPAAAYALAHSVGDERAAWDPSVTTSRWLRGSSAPADGAAYFTKSPSGRRRILRFELVDPNRLTSARLVKGQPLLADYGEGMRFDAHPEGGTKVTWKVVYKVRSPLAARAIGDLVRQSFERELSARMDGFTDAARKAYAAGR